MVLGNGMTFKSIDEIRRLLENEPDNNLDGKNVIASGTITDNSGNTHNYEILCGWSDPIARQCDSLWKSFHWNVLKHLHTQAGGDKDEFAKLVEQFSLEDAHWQWLAKHKGMYSPQYNWFYLMVDGKPQAACLIFHPKTGHLTTEPIFYIEYLAVAPWNRVNPLESKQFDGLGSILLQKVIEYAESKLSLKSGFSLHSLPKAEGFYKKIGMQTVASAVKDNMTYFEMTKSELSKFMGVQ